MDIFRLSDEYERGKNIPFFSNEEGIEKCSNVKKNYRWSL